MSKSSYVSQSHRDLVINPSILKINFQGINIPVVNYQGQPYVPMRGVVEDLGLTWNSQRGKFKNFGTRFKQIRLAVCQGRQVQVCLHLQHIPLWGKRLDPSRVRALVSRKIVDFQRACEHPDLYHQWKAQFDAFYLNVEISENMVTVSDLTCLDFHGFKVYVHQDSNNTLQVCMRPIAEAMHLTWTKQKENIIDLFYSDIFVFPIKLKSGIEQAICLPIHSVEDWLMRVRQTCNHTIAEKNDMRLFQENLIPFLEDYIESNQQDDSYSGNDDREIMDDIYDELEDSEDDDVVQSSDYTSCTDLVVVKDGVIIADSLGVAERFEKNHKHVLEKIRQIVEENQEKAEPNFRLTYYNDKNGQKRPMYELTRDGFSFLVMGFTGPKANAWKWKYIEAFNAMEEKIRSKTVGQSPQYTQQNSSNINVESILTQVIAAFKDQQTSLMECLTQQHNQHRSELVGIIKSLIAKDSTITDNTVESVKDSDNTDNTDDLDDLNEIDEIDDDIELTDDEEQEILSAKERWSDNNSVELKLRTPSTNNLKNHRYFTVAQFLKLKKLKHIELNDRRNFGFMCYELSKKREIEVKSIPNAKFNKVNLYRQDILEQVYFENFNVKDGQVVLFDPQAKYQIN